MPTITIDGHKIETSQGKTIIEAAYENGMQIPHFCWHPELSVAGNCRMCLVEVGMPKRNPDGTFEMDDDGNTKVNFIPKLQIACSTPVAEGMVVNLSNKKVIDAQEAVMEFLLINHPLDCPICDEAGECKLQEYAYKHSKAESRFDETKNHKEKRQKWGPNVMFDAERCISCSRCIRYAQEVAKQDVLTFVQRGDHVTIKLFDGHEFDNDYSMNVIELCPVGALTSPDFRFKARVWEMSFTESITPADSTGANIKIGVRNNEVLRIQPHTNMYVNKYWLSDDQRLNHHEFVNKNRITEPRIKTQNGFVDIEWSEAYRKASELLKKYNPNQVMFIGSAKATNEDNYALKQLAQEVVKSPNLDYFTHIDESFVDDFMGVADRTPNKSGVDEIGIKPTSGGIKKGELIDAINSAKIKAVFIMEENLEDYPEVLAAFDKLDTLISLVHNDNDLAKKSDLVLPASTFAEIKGTYTNKDKRVQLLHPALVTKENRIRMGMKMSRWDSFGAFNDRWTRHEQRNCRQSWRIITGIAAELGAKWNYTESEHVFNQIESKVPGFKGMSYEIIEEYQGIVLGKAENPDPKLNNYVSHVMKPD